MAQVVALSGFMGSGKSTVGPLVARSLGWRFVDLDAEIERREGRAIGRIFDEDGESGFRLVEERVLEDLVDETEEAGDLVIALGGGTVTIPGARELVRGRVRVVFLDTPTAVAWERARSSGRPLATAEEAFVRLAAERDVVYRSTADVVVSTAGLPAAAVAQRVVEALAAL